MDSIHQYDVLISGGKIVTMDAKGSVIDNGALAISGNTIEAICAVDELPEKHQLPESYARIIQGDGQ